MSVRLNGKQIERTAEFLRGLPDLPGFDYRGWVYPPVGADFALDYFFAVVLHQYGFWHDDGTRYTGPMYATLDDRPLKGSDFVWAAALRAGEKEKAFYQPEFQSRLDALSFSSLFSDDSGRCPLPMADSHLRLARGYGGDLAAGGLTPAGMVERANASPQSLKKFLGALSKISGYREDPLRKKALLLALILSCRPEAFLRVDDPEHWAPIVDYHNLRTALRLGLVEITDAALRRKATAREFVSGAEEGAIRRATYGAILRLMEVSGRSLAQVDALFFSARKICPEMTDPECPRCVLSPVCLKRTELFQPVFRTTYY